ncbi:unnamed protein product [Rhodiola kirilowii]
MGDTEDAHMDMMNRIQSSFGTSSSSLPKQHLTVGHQADVPQLNPANMRTPMRHFGSFGADSGKRIGIPPSHPHQIPPVSPYSQIPVSRPSGQQLGSQGHAQGPSHSRSLSQPAFFSFDSLPPLSPSPYRDSSSASHGHHVSGDVTMEDRDSNPHLMLPPSPYGGNGNRMGECLPPRKAHRRSYSDIPFGFNSIQSSTQLAPLRGPYTLERSMSGGDKSGTSKPAQLVKREFSWNGGNGMSTEGIRERKSEGEVIDDLFSAYLNLDNIDTLNSSETDEKNGFGSREDLVSGASGTNTVGSSDNEAESSAMGNDSAMSKLALSGSQKREGMKRSAAGDIAPTTRHYRSVSMDSFMGSMHFGDESLKLSPSSGPGPGQLSPCDSLDKNSNSFSLEFGNGEFSGAELKKIMANDKLAEIAASDPKRVKRILANRQSAARSKERKMRYISELEHKVQTLQTEATTLSAQLTLLQRDSAGLNSQNNELKFRLQAMEQQAQLRDALNEALSAEVQRLKVTSQELRGEAPSSKGMAAPQHSLNHQMFQKSQQQQQNAATKNQ